MKGGGGGLDLPWFRSPPLGTGAKQTNIQSGPHQGNLLLKCCCFVALELQMISASNLLSLSMNIAWHILSDLKLRHSTTMAIKTSVVTLKRWLPFHVLESFGQRYSTFWAYASTPIRTNQH